MISNKKRGLCLILFAAVLFVSAFSLPYPAKAAITYHNTTNTSLTCSINSSGKLHADLTVKGISGTTTLIEADLYVEIRLLGSIWARINIGYPNDVWHDSTTSYNYSNYFEHQLTVHGTYRVSVTYTVSGTGGSPDVIPKTSTAVY